MTDNKVLRLCSLIILLMGFQLSVKAQNPAAGPDTSNIFVKTPISKIVLSSEEGSEIKPQLLVQCVRQGPSRTISFIIQNVHSGAFAIDSANKVSIYVENGAQILLRSVKTVYSTFGGMGFGNYLSADYPVSRYDLSFFDEYQVGNIDIAYKGGVFEFKLTKEQSDAFKEVLNMIR